jgi:hypothetical protein
MGASSGGHTVCLRKGRACFDVVGYLSANVLLLFARRDGYTVFSGGKGVDHSPYDALRISFSFSIPTNLMSEDSLPVIFLLVEFERASEQASKFAFIVLCMSWLVLSCRALNMACNHTFLDSLMVFTILELS